MITELTYQPKGSMCINCKKQNENCSRLDFSSMPRIESFEVKQGDTLHKAIVVKCVEFESKSAMQRIMR